MSETSRPWGGGSFGGHGECVLAPNPGLMTLDGTNTWILRDADSERSVVVDPGPLDDAHLDAVADLAGDVQALLVTHHHYDHTEGARRLAERLGVAIRGLDPDQCWRADPLTDGEILSIGHLDVEVVATPGHTTDSVSFLVEADRALLTGDMVLGRGTTVIVHPDGDLGSYFDSIARMRSLVTEGRATSLWPAHGPVLADGAAVLDHYVVHRRERLAQVESALARLGRSAAELPPDVAEHPDLARQVVEIVYADVDSSLWGAAEWSVRAQLAYLADR